MTNIKSEQVFSTIGRDPTEICTFTLDENIDFETLKVREPDRNPGHTVKNFLDYFDEEIKEAQEGKTEFSLTTANIQTLQKIKQDISHMMTLSGTKYIYFLLKKGLSDHGVCLYNATENKGYCIMYHM
ncbi:hypothetical protein KGV52_00885 [Candidatus Gracilibacteria bacterium]|nr:hypothetical protein [Candidatus Gracilibacteria bacterium]